MPSVGGLLRRLLVRFGYPLIFRADVNRTDMQRLGSDYGGWWVPASLLGPESVCYTAGVGEDISFDIALLARFDCWVWASDPTPRAIAHIKSQDVGRKFAFEPVGVSGTDGEMRFYAPINPDHVSHSVANLQRTDSFFSAPVRSIARLMRDLGHNRLDLLKLDIEGAEHDAIRQMLEDDIRPRVLCVEFDQPEPLRWALRTRRALRRSGYALVKLEDTNLTFVLHGQEAAGISSSE